MDLLITWTIPDPILRKKRLVGLPVNPSLLEMGVGAWSCAGFLAPIPVPRYLTFKDVCTVNVKFAALADTPPLVTVSDTVTSPLCAATGVKTALSSFVGDRAPMPDTMAHA